MINMAFGLGQGHSGLIYYKFNVMPGFIITPTPTPTVTPTPIPIERGGHGYAGEREDESYWKTFKFESSLRGYTESHKYNVQFPIKEFKLININIKNKKIKSDINLDEK